MKVKDIMTWNVVTVSSDTPIMEARKIMETHKIRRLPVVDRGKLVGVVTLDRIVGVGPSPATSLSVWEMNYLLAKMKVKEIMQKDVVTIDPEASIEHAIAYAQKNKVGIMPVLENGKVVGLVTTTDFALKILNPALGIGKPGTRINIENCNQAKSIKEVMEIVEKLGLKIIAAHTMPPSEETAMGFSLHVDTDDVKQLIKEIEAKGQKALIVAR
jgi:acetoin utilization protein AcuB